MPPHKGGQYVRKGGKHKIFRCPKPQSATQGCTAKKFGQAAIFFKAPARMFEDRFALRRDAQSMGVAVDEVPACRGLQLLKMLAYGGLPQSQRPRCAAERTGGGDRREAAQQVRIK